MDPVSIIEYALLGQLTHTKERKYDIYNHIYIIIFHMWHVYYHAEYDFYRNIHIHCQIRAQTYIYMIYECIHILYMIDECIGLFDPHHCVIFISLNSHKHDQFELSDCFVFHQPPKIPGWNHPKTIIHSHLVGQRFSSGAMGSKQEPNLM